MTTNDFDSMPLGSSGQPRLEIRAARAASAAEFFGAGDAIALVVGANELQDGSQDEDLVRAVANLVEGDLNDLRPRDPEAKSAPPEQSRRSYVYPWGGRRRRLLAVALAADAGPAALRVEGDRAMRELRKLCKRVGFVLPRRWRQDGAVIAALVEGMVYGNFNFGKYKTGEPARGVEEALILCEGPPADDIVEAIAGARAIAEAAMVAKSLTLEPPDRLYPAALAERAVELASGLEHVRCEAWSEDRIRAERLTGLLAVGRGSSNPVAQIEWVYEPPGGAERTIVLVGKGVTYDSGGLQDKGPHMNHMNRDMAGAAAVLGMMQAVDRLRPKVRVVGLAGAAENMSGASAFKTDDILVHRDGKTAQIGHTDAEGRLVLYDQLVYARETHNPELIIDMATLTGAVRFALGTDTFGVMCNKRGVAARDALLAAAKQAGEKAWPLPLSHDLPNSEYVVTDYEKNFNEVMLGKFADLDNDGDREYGAGPSKGGAYLASAVADQTAWLHLDVAFTAMDGPMGSPVPTLCHFLQTRG